VLILSYQNIGQIIVVQQPICLMLWRLVSTVFAFCTPTVIGADQSPWGGQINKFSQVSNLYFGMGYCIAER
jgi:hypothetical protein